MTSARTIRHVDAFTTTPLEGNPAAVVDGEGLAAETMQRIALNQHLSETVFLLPPQSRDEPRAHPHLHAGHRAAVRRTPDHRRGAHADQRRTRARSRAGESLRLETGAGVIPVEVGAGEPPLYTMTQAAPQFRPSEFGARRRSPPASGSKRGDILRAEWVSTGIFWLLAQIASLEAMMRVQPDMMALLKIPHGLSIFCIGAQTAGCRHPRPRVRARGRRLRGSRHRQRNGCIAALIAKHGLLPARDGEIRYVAEQGHRDGAAGPRAPARTRRAGRALRARRRQRRHGAARRTAAARLMVTAAILLAAGRRRRSTACRWRCCRGATTRR